MKVLLIGDSIRMGYAPLVTEKLRGQFDVSGPEENAGTSRNTLEHLDQWLVGINADIIHVNCGLHDLAREDTLLHRVAVEEYKRNLDLILSRLKTGMSAKIVWATTTPVIDEWHRNVKSFERRQEDVLLYNNAAIRAAQQHGVQINDLHAVIESAGRENCLTTDGVHMNEIGNRLLAEAVSDCIRRIAGD